MLSYKMYKWCCFILVIYGFQIGNHIYTFDLLCWFSFCFGFLRAWKELYPMFIKYWNVA